LASTAQCYTAVYQDKPIAFIASKQALINDQGWKVVDLTAHREYICQSYYQIPEKTYSSLGEVVNALEVAQ
jgi:hypothetical protein